MSNFAFLLPEWPGIYEASTKAEQTARADPRTACFYARRALELALHWAYKADGSLHLPYNDRLSALIHEPTFKQAAGEAVFAKARLINSIGNRAVHDRYRQVPQSAALTAVEELFHVCYWLAHTYARKPPLLTFGSIQRSFRRRVASLHRLSRSCKPWRLPSPSATRG